MNEARGREIVRFGVAALAVIERRTAGLLEDLMGRRYAPPDLAWCADCGKSFRGPGALPRLVMHQARERRWWSRG